jgi:transcriptional regulator with XRE-family HTH domain
MAKPRRGRSTAAAIDDHVGGRIRERRIMLGLTQQQLAEMIGVTYQQAHKYERGINRVSAGRLFEIARVLSAPITYFYEGIGEEGPRQITLHHRRVARNADRSRTAEDEAKIRAAWLSHSEDASPFAPIGCRRLDAIALGHRTCSVSHQCSGSKNATTR